MMMSLAMMIAVLASLVLPVAGVVAVVTYVRRTRHLERLEGDGLGNAQILDSLDRVHIRLDAVAERLERMERRERMSQASDRPPLIGEPDPPLAEEE